MKVSKCRENGKGVGLRNYKCVWVFGKLLHIVYDSNASCAIVCMAWHGMARLIELLHATIGSEQSESLQALNGKPSTGARMKGALSPESLV